MYSLTHALRSAPALIILSVIMVILQFYTPVFYTWSFHSVFNAKEIGPMIFIVIYTGCVALFLPLLVNYAVFKKPLKDFGLCLPVDWIKTIFLLTVSCLLLVPPILWLAKQPSVHHFYSLKNQSNAEIAFYFLIAYPPYYFAEEFFFRGFLFLSLRQKIGWHSYWITELIYTWAHSGKPLLELLFSFPAGLVLNYLTQHSRSFYPAILVHYIVGVILVTQATYFF